MVDWSNRDDKILQQIGLYPSRRPSSESLALECGVWDKNYAVVQKSTKSMRSFYISFSYQARALRALGLLLADGTPTVGGGEDFLSRQPKFFTETAVTPERKVEKWFPRWEINRHAEG